MEAGEGRVPARQKKPGNARALTRLSDESIIEFQLRITLPGL